MTQNNEDKSCKKDDLEMLRFTFDFRILFYF